MKTLAIISALLVSTAFSAQARTRTADQLETVVTCQNTPAKPDYAKKVVIRTGGVAGLTIASVHTMFVGRVTDKDLVVQRVFTRRIGAPIDYVADGFKLSVNYTVQPNANGMVVGRLTEDGVSELMKCK